MMNNMMPGMMWGMGIFWLLAAIVLILATAALVKYLRSGNKAGPQ
jgi:tellurite resistance protein TehA-like permease